MEVCISKNWLKLIISKVIIFATILFLFPGMVLADVYVNGYFRSNGTYVQGHYRSSPDSNPYNNWSYPGNTNPYTGETAGGNPDTYLNNYYNRSDNSTYVPTYTPTYSPPAYSGGSQSSFESVDGGYKSYGVLVCNSDYYKEGSSCKRVPSNGYSLIDSFACSYGYQKYGDSCVNIPANAYYDGSTWQCNYGFVKSGDVCSMAPVNSSSNGLSWWCNSGFTQYGNSCIATVPNAHINVDKWECDASFYFDSGTDRCIHISQICSANLGPNSYGVGSSCYCKQGYQFNNDKSYCVQIEAARPIVNQVPSDQTSSVVPQGDPTLVRNAVAPEIKDYYFEVKSDEVEQFVTEKKLNSAATLRSCPSVKCRALKYFLKDTKLSLVGKYKKDNWYKVRAPDSLSDGKDYGWVHQSLFQTTIAGSSGGDNSKNKPEHSTLATTTKSSYFRNFINSIFGRQSQ